MEFFSSAEEVKEALERRKMESEVTVLAFQSLLKKADTEELQALANIFLRCGTDDQPVAIWYSGIVSGILNERSGKCYGCGKDHSVNAEDFQPPEELPSWEDFLKDCAYWNVDPAGSVVTCPVMCKGCQRVFPDLDDRKLRKDCPNCIEKSKWG